MEGPSRPLKDLPNPDGDKPNRDKAIEVAIAEFNALRAEIVNHITAQAALVGLALTAVGVILGFALKEGADQRVLLAIPILTLLVVLLHTAETHRSASIGRYIGEELWEYFEEHVGRLKSWEAKVAQRRQRPLSIMLPEIFLLDFPAMLIFILASGYALVQVGSGGFLWWFDCGAVAVSIIAPLGFALQIRGESAALADQAEQSGTGGN